MYNVGSHYVLSHNRQITGTDNCTVHTNTLTPTVAIRVQLCQTGLGHRMRYSCTHTATVGVKGLSWWRKGDLSDTQTRSLQSGCSS